MLNQEEINTVTKKLKDAYEPEIKSIYLFGSYAWGEVNEDSDLDIIVVVGDSDEKPYKRPIQGIRALRGMKIPKDIIVYTKDEFESLIKDKGSLCYEVVDKGVKLYES